MTFRADMHCHTLFSDGTNTPDELLDIAKEKGLSGLSITDHDTFAGYSDALFAKAKKLGIILCTGIEFSCTYRDTTIHILGYNFALDSKPLIELCREHEEAREERNAIIIANLRKHGMMITMEDVCPPGVKRHIVGRLHIAEALLKKGYIEHLQEAFQLHIASGKPCYEPGKPFEVENCIDIIHEAGGKAFIAHPHFIRGTRVLKDLLEMEFDGIECYYANFHANEVQKWVRVAEEHDLLLCGGSDYHGAYKKNLELGASWTSKEDFDKIYELPTSN